MKRKKRAKKGLESLKERIKEHEIKLEIAKEDGNEERVKYYIKDLARLKGEEKKKEDIIDKEEAN
jgi:hypothetical protein